jgi:cell division transport system permease protein
MVTASILPASFEVTVSEPATLEEIYQNYSTRTTIIDEIIYQKDVINSLLNWTKNIRITGILITSIIGLISLLTIITIIGMKITNRKEEINISRLLGASKFYVKKPFLLEGLFYGLFGSFFGFIFTFIIILIIRNSVNNFFQPVIFFNINPVFYLEILLIELSVGSILGLFASWIGSNRYIKY